MAGAVYPIVVEARGPIFDGAAPEAVREFLDKATQHVAEKGQGWIRTAADAMDRSGRGGTGRAAAGVLIYPRGSGKAIFGAMEEGQVWWPWLEGVSSRNRSTRFKGYHTFRDTARRLDDELASIIRPDVDELDRRLGGA